jgi:23S rRNA pseudouridine2605 synthase
VHFKTPTRKCGAWGTRGSYNLLVKRKASARRASSELRKVGLARALSKMGFCSRARAVELIRGGRVRINGGMRSDPETPVHLGKDRIEVDGKVVGQSEKIYLMMNKPRGVVTSASDELGRKTVYDLLGKDLAWVAPVGRLDKASEGLLLITNDSEWAARITAPESRVEKIYHVQIGGNGKRGGLAEVQERLPARFQNPHARIRHMGHPHRDHAELVEKLTDGLTVDGEFLRVKSAKALRAGERNSWVEIILDEGKNRQIRRMFEAMGIEVLRLMRVGIGELELGALAKSGVRALNEEERAKVLGRVRDV